MRKDEVMALSANDRQRMSHGFSFRAKAQGKTTKASSHTHGGRSQASRGWEADGPSNVPTKALPGWSKVSMPRNHIRYIRPADVPRRGPNR